MLFKRELAECARKKVQNYFISSVCKKGEAREDLPQKGTIFVEEER